MSEIPATTQVAPATACLTTRIAARKPSPKGANASDARQATGIAAGAVPQWTGAPKASEAKTSIAAAMTSVNRNGKTSIEITAPTGPNGESTIRSKVPATSACRSVVGGVGSVELAI